MFYNNDLILSCNGLLLSTVKNLFPHTDKSLFTTYSMLKSGDIFKIN